MPFSNAQRQAFKKGQRFRVGIEGRISVLFSWPEDEAIRSKGHERFEVLVGAAVLANNLMRVAAMLRDGKPAHAKRVA